MKCLEFDLEKSASYAISSTCFLLKEKRILFEINFFDLI